MSKKQEIKKALKLVIQSRDICRKYQCNTDKIFLSSSIFEYFNDIMDDLEYAIIRMNKEAEEK